MLLTGCRFQSFAGQTKVTRVALISIRASFRGPFWVMQNGDPALVLDPGLLAFVVYLRRAADAQTSSSTPNVFVNLLTNKEIRLGIATFWFRKKRWHSPEQSH